MALLVCEELFLPHGIKTLVGFLVQAPFLLEIAQDFLHTVFVAGICSGSPTIVLNSQPLPERNKTLCHHIGIFLRLHARGFRLLLNFLPVLVYTRQQKHLFTTHSVPASQNICQNLLIGMPDMRGAVRVINCCCNVEHSGCNVSTEHLLNQA